MSTELPVQEVRQKFSEIAALCKQLKERNIIDYGMRFSLRPDRTVRVDPIPFERGPEEVIKTARQSIEVLRMCMRRTSRVVDVGTGSWRQSLFVQVADALVEMLQTQVYAIENPSLAPMPYNARSVMYLLTSIGECIDLMRKWSFRLRTPAAKFRKLESFAREFKAKNDTMRFLIYVSHQAELIMLFGDAMRQYPDDEKVIKFMRRTLEVGVGETIRTFFTAALAPLKPAEFPVPRCGSGRAGIG